MSRRITATTVKADQDGSALIEFALIAPVFFMLLMGIFDLGHGVYLRSVLQGAMQQAGRNTGLQSGIETLDDIDEYVRKQVENVMPTADVTFTRRSFENFEDIGTEEEFEDRNGNNIYDANECFFDTNNNGIWDLRGSPGLGGARDVVEYTATVEYDHIFPLWAFIGGPKQGKVIATTILRTQPYGVQKVTPVKRICP